MFTLLCIDDEPGLLEIAQLFLESTGEFTVTTALSADAGLRLLAQHDFDAIISDYQMPEMDGIELLKNVRKSYGNIPFILFSGRGREEVVIEAVNNGVDFYVQKGGDPRVQFTELAYKVRQTISWKRADLELRAAYEQLSATDEELRGQYEELAAAQAELQKHERQLNEITGTTPGVVYQFSARPDGTMGMHYVSDRSQDVLGISSNPDDFFERFTRQVDSRDREAFLDSITAAVSSKSPLDFTGRFLKPSGETIWVQAISRPFLRTSEIVFSGFLLDITDRKHAEDELRLLKLSTDRSSDEIFWMDFKGNILYVNDAACRITGYSRDEFLKMKIFQLDPDFPPEVWDASVAELRERKTQFITTRHRRKDGVIIDVEIVAVYVSQYDQEYSFAYVRDITERKRADAALFESEAKFRAVIDQSFQFIGLMTPAGIVIEANRTALAFAGLSESDVINKPFWDTPWWSHSKELQENLKDAVHRAASGETVRFEATHPAADGQLLSLDFSVKPVLDPAGRILFLIPEGRDITGHKRAEEALRESEEKYRMLVEHIRDGVFIIQDGRLVFYNKALTGLSGYTAEELDGKLLSDLIAPEDREMVVSRTRERAQGRQVPELYEFSLLHKDGTRRIRVRVSAGLGIFKGRPASIGTFYNVTEDRRREEALRESEAKYRNLAELLPQIVFEMDQNFIITFLNQRGYDNLGYRPGDVVLEFNALSLIDPSQHDRFRQNIQKLLTRQPYDVLEYTFIRKNGSTFPALIYADPILNGTEPAGFRGIIIDITELKIAELALLESEEKYRTLVEVNHDIIYSMKTDGTILYASPQTTAQLGYRPDELEGRNFTDFIHPDDIGSLVLHIRQNFSTGKPLTSDRFRIRRKDGTFRWYEDKTIYATDRQNRQIIAGTIRDITEEKAAQDALRESEEKFRALVETTGDFVWEVDAAGVYTYVSPQVRQILGYEPEELAGRTPFDLMPPEEAERVAAEFNRCVTSRLPIISLENKNLRKDGSAVILETSGVLRYDDQGRFAGYRGIDRDITERKRAEEALKESEARLSSILHGSPVLQFVIDRNHRVISWNNALEEYSGIKAEDMIGTDQQWRAFYLKKRPVLADLLIDGNTDAITRLYAEKLKKPRYVEGAYEATDFFPQMGSSGIWLSFTAAPLRDVQGTIIGAVETLEDVTERIEGENALREREEWTRTILDTAEAGIILVDANTHRIVDTNRKALELIGLPRESVIGTVCHRFICPAEEGKCPVTDCGQEIYTSERVLITASGEKIPVLKTVVRVSMGSRDILVESFVDIAKQKRSEAAIRETNRKLNLLNSITRHDIRNQLTAVQGYTQLAALSKPDAKVTDFLARISAAIETIQSQIEFTKEYQELGMQAPGWFPVSGALSGIRPEAIALRNTCIAVEIFADPMIDKVFFNLFDNAVKHGGRVTNVTIRCEQKGEDLVITFADNGIGIPVREKQKIFEKGYGKNTGFGLFLVREILAITGITIRETGKRGRGAVFEITVQKGGFRKGD